MARQTPHPYPLLIIDSTRRPPRARAILPAPYGVAAVLGWCLVALPAVLSAPDRERPRARPLSPVSRPGAAEDEEFFEKQVRPVLAERCFSCHGPKLQQAGLRLDSRDALLAGAAGKPILVPGDPEKSPLIQALRYTGSVRMPPAGKLAPQEIASLTEWVRRGAPWGQSAGGKEQGAAVSSQQSAVSRKARTAFPERPGTRGAGGPNAERLHWSFQPVRKPPAPPVKGRAWVRSPIDAFVLAQLEQHGLRPAMPADPRTLIRRVTFDLTGLPPTPEEVTAFVAECAAEGSVGSVGSVGSMGSVGSGSSSHTSHTPHTSHTAPKIGMPNAQRPTPSAYERLIDRLLASPRFGERWGRHWLDVVRYCDSFDARLLGDQNAGRIMDVTEAWRYRDWVVGAFNQDLPYDQFILAQIAGDLIGKWGNWEMGKWRDAAGQAHFPITSFPNYLPRRGHRDRDAGDR